MIYPLGDLLHCVTGNRVAYFYVKRYAQHDIYVAVHPINYTPVYAIGMQDIIQKAEKWGIRGEIYLFNKYAITSPYIPAAKATYEQMRMLSDVQDDDCWGVWTTQTNVLSL